MNMKKTKPFNSNCNCGEDAGLLDGIQINVEGMANLKLPDPGLVDYYSDLQNRIYRLQGEVDDTLLNLITLIMKCNLEDKDIPVEDRVPIKVYINSNGGDAIIAWSVMQAIRTSKTPVWTIAFPYAYSAAADILTAGHKRFTIRGGQCMFHTGSGVYFGEQSTIESAKKHNDKLLKKMKDFTLENTKIPPRTYNAKASSDIWYDDEDMLKFGVVDRIIEDFTEIM